jgi:hypothetical protein
MSVALSSNGLMDVPNRCRWEHCPGLERPEGHRKPNQYPSGIARLDFLNSHSLPNPADVLSRNQRRGPTNRGWSFHSKEVLELSRCIAQNLERTTKGRNSRRGPSAMRVGFPLTRP